jgi:hypothetical protein
VGLAAFGEALDAGVGHAREACRWILDNAAEDAYAAGSASVNYLMLLGYVCGGWVMGQSALKARALLDTGASDESFLRGKVSTARFYADHFLPRAGACLAAITAGSEDIMALSAEQF